MKRVLRAVCVIVILFFLTPVSAQEQMMLSFDSVIAAALKANSSLTSLQDNLTEQLDNLGIKGYFDGIGLSLSGGISGNPENPFAYTGNGSLSAAVEIIPQLSISGSFSGGLSNTSVDDLNPSVNPFTGTVGLIFSPLADTTSGPVNRLEIEISRLNIISKTWQVSYQAVIQLLNAVLSNLEVPLSARKFEIAENIMEATSVLYNKDLVTKDQYDSAVQSLHSKRQIFYQNRIDNERKLEILSHTIDIPADEIILPELSSLDLTSIITDAQTSLDSLDINNLVEDNISVRSAMYDITAAEIALSGTKIFSPHLSLSTAANLPDLSYSAGVSFSFYVSDFNFDAQEDAEDNLVNIRDELDYTRKLTEYDLRSAILNLQFALEDYKVSAESLEQSKIDLNETVFFSKRGEVTDIELAEAEMAVLISENNLVHAEIQVTSAWLTIFYGQY